MSSHACNGKYARLIVFDMDSTLIDAETIDELAKAAGVGDEVAEITRRAMNGEMDYGEALRKRVALLRGLSVERAIEAVDQIQYNPGAKELVDRVRSLGYRTAMISGGFTLSADRIGRELGMDYVYSNELVVNGNIFTGEVRGPLTEHDSKMRVLIRIAKEEGVDHKKCVVIGDGANDIQLFKEAGCRIAFNSKPVLQKYADVVVEGNDLHKVIPIIETLGSESDLDSTL
ncbi:phosphoserine phosphatase SerB [Methanosarcinales archaeon ex4484_138]|nr:MAG: phosphoserine phosphatase SerB [Methanosarcinales archaeon ex4484_138]HHI30383.1 phosphoserine phosphatase SerB [Candidatus Methanoperedenaceae archaeon]